MLSTLFVITNTKHGTKRTTMDKVSSVTANTRPQARRTEIVSMSARSSKANHRMVKDIVRPTGENLSPQGEKEDTIHLKTQACTSANVFEKESIASDEPWEINAYKSISHTALLL